jgi:putative ABC transport system permease protein
MLLRLALSSLRNRALTAALTVLSIALAVLLLLAVERLRGASRDSFAATVSGTDLIVGARSSPVHLLLSAVFRIGNATNAISPRSWQVLAARPEVAWTIPVSLGDSFRGYRVVGTTGAFFEHFRFAGQRRLVFAAGGAFRGERDAVLGAEVARGLGLAPGASVVIAHGAGEVSFSLHEESPFKVTGVLSPTGTPVDRGVYVSLAGLNAVHAPVNTGVSADPLAEALARRADHDPDHASEHPEVLASGITAVFVGLHNRAAALAVQRAVNEHAAEPLTAILPGVTLQEVWEITGVVERTLFAVSVLVVLVGLAGMLVALLTSLGERRREMAVLRAVGARPAHVFGLILGEAALVTLAGIVVGVAALGAGLALAQDAIAARFGLLLPVAWLSARECALLAAVAVAGVLIGLLPAWRCYRQSLADGMTIRI